MSGASGSDVPELIDYVRVLRRRALIVVACLLLGVVAAAVYVLVAPKTYQSSADVLVRPIDPLATQQAQRNRNAAGQINVDTEAQIVKSSTVASGAGRRLGTTSSPQSLAQDISVTVPPNSTVLSISAQAVTPRAAQARAQAFANAYLDARAAAAQGAARDRIATLRDQATALTTELSSISGRVEALPRNSPDRSVAVSRQTQLQNQLSTLNSDIAEASAAPVDPGVILRPAPLISSPSSPVALICFVAGALLGLLVGVALAVLLERRDTRLRDEDDFESLTPVPVLVRVPAGRSALAPALVDPDSAIGDAYRQLRTGLLAGNTENPPHVLTVASCAPATDSGPVAVNLAAALHRAGFRTVLVSAHMRGSSVAELLQLSSDPGLGDVLRGVKPLREIVQYSPYIAGLPIIVGRKGDGAIDMLQNGRMAELVTALRSSFDMVLLEAAPVLTGGDARDIAVLGDGLLLVAEPNQTHRDEVATSVRRLRLVNAPLTGLVLVDEPQPRGRSSAAAPAIDSSPTPVLSTPTEA